MSFELSSVLPIAPLHWTSIMHYLLLLGALAMLFVSSGNSSNGFVITIMALALVTAASLYIDRLPLTRLYVFLIRVGLAAMTMLLAGLGPNKFSRQMGLLISLFSLPLLTSTFLGCMVSVLMDPRIASWCL